MGGWVVYMKTELEDGVWIVQWKILAVREQAAAKVSCTLKYMVSPHCFRRSLKRIQRKNKKLICKINILTSVGYIERDRSYTILSRIVLWISAYQSICLSYLLRMQVVINMRCCERFLYKWPRKENMFSMFLIFWFIYLFPLSKN